MNDKLPYNPKWFRADDTPTDFVPAGCETIVGIDYGSPDGDCTARGFFAPKDGTFHIQDVSYNTGGKPHERSDAG